jgi:dephospho-CoA kinase
MKIVGITGGIGSGKSIICKVLEKIGYPVFYSDDVAKELIQTDPIIIQDLTNLIGSELYHNGFQKQILADKIFNNNQLKEKVNQIVHPRVRLAFEVWTSEQKSPIVFNEAAILFETGMYKKYDKTILVCAPKSIKIKRVINRDGLSEEAIRARMNNQWTDEEKIKLTDFVIVNDDELPLLPQIDRVVFKILAA